MGAREERMSSIIDKLRGVGKGEGTATNGPVPNITTRFPKFTWGEKKQKKMLTRKERLRKKLDSLKDGFAEKLKEKAVQAITGGVSGLLVLLTIYKVISNRESVLADSRKDIERQERERKQRLAYLRRSLAGPLRSAARDLSTRITEILAPTPGPAEGATGTYTRRDYFSGHYIADPEMSINSTLYRLCLYLYWVDQLATNIHSGVSAFPGGGKLHVTHTRHLTTGFFIIHSFFFFP